MSRTRRRRPLEHAGQHVGPEREAGAQVSERNRPGRGGPAAAAEQQLADLADDGVEVGPRDELAVAVDELEAAAASFSVLFSFLLFFFFRGGGEDGLSRGSLAVQKVDPEEGRELDEGQPSAAAARDDGLPDLPPQPLARQKLPAV